MVLLVLVPVRRAWGVLDLSPNQNPFCDAQWPEPAYRLLQQHVQTEFGFFSGPGATAWS